MNKSKLQDSIFATAAKKTETPAKDIAASIKAAMEAKEEQEDVNTLGLVSAEEKELFEQFEQTAAIGLDTVTKASVNTLATRADIKEQLDYYMKTSFAFSFSRGAWQKKNANFEVSPIIMKAKEKLVIKATPFVIALVFNTLCERGELRAGDPLFVRFSRSPLFYKLMTNEQAFISLRNRHEISIYHFMQNYDIKTKGIAVEKEVQAYLSALAASRVGANAVKSAASLKMSYQDLFTDEAYIKKMNVNKERARAANARFRVQRDRAEPIALSTLAVTYSEALATESGNMLTAWEAEMDKRKAALKK